MTDYLASTSSEKKKYINTFTNHKHYFCGNSLPELSITLLNGTVYIAKLCRRKKRKPYLIHYKS